MRTPVRLWTASCTLASCTLLATAAPVLAQLENYTVPAVQSSAWWWPWGTMLGTTGLIMAICFKHPKRSHDN